MNELRAAPGVAKPRRRWLSAVVVVAALLAGVGVGIMLPDSTTQLEAAHQQVESLTTRTELLSTELTGARTDNSSLSDLFEDAESEVRVLGKKLDAARERGDARESKLDQRAKALDREEKDLVRREKVVDQRQDAFDQRQDALDQQEKELAQREKVVDQRQDALDQRKSDLDQRESELDQQEAAASSGTRGDRR